MTDFLQVKCKEIDDRLKELAPLVEEHRRLEAATKALDGIPAASPNSARSAVARARTGRRPGRPRGSALATKATPASPAPKARTVGKRAGGRRKGSGKRSTEALAIIREQPGVTIPEIAGRMGIEKTYLYRILPDLERDGAVRKENRTWHPVTAQGSRIETPSVR